MRILRVGCGTLNQTPLDFSGNLQRILHVMTQARDQEVGVLLLPELAITGYGCEDEFFSPTTFDRSEESLQAIAEQSKGMTVVVGLPVRHRGSAYNCAAVVQDGKVVGVNPKKMLPREGVHYEYRWFRPWAFGEVSEVFLNNQAIPFGDVRYRLGQVRMAVEICEEAWGAIPAVANHAEAVDLVVNPSASHFGRGRYSKRATLVADSSRALQVAYAYANPVGLEAGRLIYDGGCFIAQDGQFLVKGKRFGYRDFDLCHADIDLHRVRSGKMRNRSVSVVGRVEDWGAEITGGEVPLRAKLEEACESVVGAPVTCDDDNQEFFWALTTGLYDYFRKARAGGYAVSLSGGVDSATCAVAIAHMFAEAKKRGVKIDGEMQDRLTCVYQATQFSGDVTRNAAQALAKEIGASFHDIDVQPIVDEVLKNTEQMAGRKLTWERDDLALQNMQARARAASVWAIANLKNAILVTTSNRSEGAVGYATMDGDTAGGLAPLAGIDKRFLRQWLRWAEKICPFGLGPLASLSHVNQQSPTAELRPQDAEQTDEKDLMPYDVMERIEAYFVCDKLDHDDIVMHLQKDFPDVNQARLDEWVQRFTGLWRRSQWKRERLAPSFHLDSFSVDPKTWCRYPILSG